MFHFDSTSIVAKSAATSATTENTSGTAVIVSTRGRPDIVNALVKELGRQTRPPAHIFIIATRHEDIAMLDQSQENLTVRIGRPGSTFQRNDGLALAGSKFSYIVFFDDDFVPSRFWIERMEALFEARPDVAGITGHVLDDGTRTAGIPLADAQAMVNRRDATPEQHGVVHDHFAYGGNVGCNMAYRYSIMHDIKFDEQLPAYAWHEDSDFRGQVERRGPFVRAEDLWGVHLGHKAGRSSGLALGYSQIANPVYLAKKGYVPTRILASTAWKNVAVNALRSFNPEPFVDRRGRFRGNMIALRDLFMGRLRPDRILEL